MSWGILTAKEFQEFELRRDMLRTKGISLDYTAEPVEGGFKVVLNEDYDLDELDLMSEAVVI
tara:strand:+ start:298 stop:483 length:186 start_codon:yes stop_codon:yes gene_type:complete